jgi:hypothetical protein
MHFEELDSTTRQRMVAEFDSEQASGNPYCGKNLSLEGVLAFPRLVRAALEGGTEQTLQGAFVKIALWNPTEDYVRNGVPHSRRVNIAQASERLALTEFNTWYVRGLSRRLRDEGVAECQAYRAAMPKWEPAECSEHEDQIFRVEQIYAGHRVKYWPEPGTPNAISIPFGPGCHHTIRRIAH